MQPTRTEKHEIARRKKADRHFAVRPRYWVSQDEVFNRSTHVPPSLITAAQNGNEDLARQIITLWLAGYRGEKKRSRRRTSSKQCSRRTSVVWDSVQSILTERLTNEADAPALQQEYPLTEKDIALMDKANSFVWLARVWVAHRVPKWLIAFRDITNATLNGIFIFSVLPFAAVGHNAPLLISRPHAPALLTCLLANFNSLVFDYVARQKVGGTHLTFFIIRQLPVLAPDRYSDFDVLFLKERVSELIYTATNLRPFADAIGEKRGPFRWDGNRRALLRAEIDAYFAHLYGSPGMNCDM